MKFLREKTRDRKERERGVGEEALRKKGLVWRGLYKVFEGRLQKSGG